MGQMFGYSVPIVGYMLVSLSVSTVDKWAMKAAYSDALFPQYVRNCQFAFAANIVSVVMGMYLLPVLCRLVEAGELVVLVSKIRSHYLLSLIGTNAVAVGMYSYARMTGGT
ncbi:MAG: hypothetical protein WCC36_18515 [Gammaproteobacteria bacterium]